MKNISTESCKKRIGYIDIAKGIGILLVIIGHISQNSNLSGFIYSFHMPLFFAISGFLYKNKKDFIKNRVKGLLLPYLFFSIISYIYWIIIENKIRNQTGDSLKLFFNIFLGIGGDDNYLFNVSLWFLPCLFMTETIFYVIDKKIKNKFLIFISVIILSIIGYLYITMCGIRLPFSLDTSLITILFYFGGNTLKWLEDKKNFYKKITKNKSNKIISTITFILLIILLVIINKVNGNVNINNLKLNNYVLTNIAAFDGIIIIIGISMLINKNKILQYLGQNSLIIMCIHEPIKRIIIFIISKIANISQEFLRYNIISILIITAVLLLILLPFIVIINKYFPFLIAKKLKKRKILVK